MELHMANQEQEVYEGPNNGGARQYMAEALATKHGKHSAMCYRIPGTDETYTFTFKRISKDHQLYQCQQCKSKGKWTGIRMIGNQFFTDPCTLDHHPECNPIKTAHNLVDRTVYEFNRGVQDDNSYARATPKPVWHEQMAIVKEKAAQEPEMWAEMVSHHYRRGTVSRRSAIKRVLKTHRSDETVATMDHIPDSLSRLPDGSMFVHRLEPTLHVYYNSNTVQMAARNGLYALVADGVHSFQPRQLKRKGQLYTVHGVCRNGVEVPLLYAISSKKTEQVYTTIFRHIRDEFNASVFPANLRVVLDFEKASINAVKRVFPDATVQGCAFHLAQAWNRRRDRVGLPPFINGARKSFEVEAWWETIKGVVFLPRRLHREVRALRTPPVAAEHPAYRPCAEFLKYLEETWYTGMFADLWNKFDVEELRTTNLAEAYHNQLNTLMDGDHPTLTRLIEVLRDLESEAESALIRLQQVPSHTKYIRTKDRERRENIAHEMRTFSARYPQGVTRSEIEQFCRTMSRYVSNKTI
ncbi:hypothetical protein Y032_0007g3367 [Ancylostoma ceylanicum]|nr:hypothetical protein Y032_0007g3367 [Ancylostoma ceylanicum]